MLKALFAFNVGFHPGTAPMASRNHDFGLHAFSLGQRLSSATHSSITSAQARSGFWDASLSRAHSLLEGCQFVSLSQPPLEIRRLHIKYTTKSVCCMKVIIFTYLTQIEPSKKKACGVVFQSQKRVAGYPGGVSFAGLAAGEILSIISAILSTLSSFSLNPGSERRVF
jgi:hypothetical protein